MEFKSGKHPGMGLRIRDIVRILGAGFRGIGKVVKGLWVGVQLIGLVVRPLWNVIRLIGRFFAGIINVGRDIKKSHELRVFQ